MEDYFHLLAWLCPPAARRLVLGMLRLLKDWIPSLCEHELRRALRSMTGLAKLGGANVSPWWRVLCYWEVCIGFSPYVPDTDLEPEVIDWLVKANKNGLGMGEEEYHRRLYLKARDYLLHNWRKPDEVPTVDEWLARGIWMRGRGGTGGKTTVYSGGRRIRTRSNKGVDAVTATDYQLAKELKNVTPQVMVVLQKSEPGKVRPVVKADNANFRKMDYLSCIVEKGLRRSRRIALFHGSDGDERMDISILRNLHRGYNVPLDQGSFDHRQGKPSILTILVALYDVCIASSGHSEMEEVWAAFWDSFTHKDSKVILGKKEYRWQNGVASGWRWTGLLDSLLNLCSFDVLTEEAARGRNHQYWSSIHMGDDIHFKVNSIPAIRALIEQYNNNGYEVHPAKTYVSHRRTEFLRRSYEEGGIVGYLPRTLVSLLARNPITDQPISKASRFSDRLTLGLLATLRGASPRAVSCFLLEDAKQMGLRREDVCDFALTPAAVGGAGLSAVSGPLAHCLMAHTTGRWLKPVVVETEAPVVKTSLGAWARRVDSAGVRLDPDLQAGFVKQLAQSWGIREKAVTGKVSEVWEEQERMEAVLVEGGMQLPGSNQLWEEKNIPTMLAPVWKKQLIRDGRWLNYIKEEHRTTVELLAKRISRGLLESYLLGELHVPLPIVDQVAPKYGHGWKRCATEWVLRALSSNGCDKRKFIKKLLWIEERGKQELSKYRIYGVVAV